MSRTVLHPCIYRRLIRSLIDEKEERGKDDDIKKENKGQLRDEVSRINVGNSLCFRGTCLELCKFKNETTTTVVW